MVDFNQGVVGIVLLPDFNSPLQPSPNVGCVYMRNFNPGRVQPGLKVCTIDKRDVAYRCARTKPISIARLCLHEKFQPGSSSARVDSLYDRQKR